MSLDEFFPIGDDDWSAFDAAARNQKQTKTDFEKISDAYDMLEDAEVMQVFDDVVWIAVNRESWENFTGKKLDTEGTSK